MKILGQVLLGIISGIAAWLIAEAIGFYIFGSNVLQITTTVIYAIIGVSVALLYVDYKKWVLLGVYIFSFIFTYPPVVLLIINIIGCAVGQCLIF